jgi:glycosyltransferase involved in cell wall biosynthesis
MPVYNGEPYIQGAFESLAAQTFDDYEIIVSDNASSDATEEICRAAAAGDSRIRYIRQPVNRGASPNFNEVVRLATGELFKWATHDDVLDPVFLERCVETLKAAPAEVVLCYPKTILIDADGKELGPYEDLLDLREERPSARFETYLRNYELSNPVFGLHRLEPLLKTRLLGNYHSSDLVLLTEIALRGQIWEIPEPLFFRRWHEGMSRQANVSDSEVTQWFDPDRSGGHVMPRTRLYAENLRAIANAPMSSGEKLRSTRALFGVWSPRYWRVVGGEWKRELFSALPSRQKKTESEQV